MTWALLTHSHSIILVLHLMGHSIHLPGECMGREQSRIGNIIRLFKNGCVSFPVSPSVANPPYKIRRPPYFRCLNWTMLYLLYLLYLDLKINK